MKLYSFPSAPSPQRVHIFMKEKGIEVPTDFIDMMKQEQLTDEYKAINPRGTVPALVLDDGTVISEVTAICRYFEASNPDNPLFGSDAKQQAVIAEWDHRVEMELLMGVAEAFRNRGEAFKNRALPGPLDIEQIPELVTRGVKKINFFFEILNKQLANNAYVAGDEFSVADITAFVCVNFAGWVKITVPEELVHLRRWLDEMSQRPSMQP